MQPGSIERRRIADLVRRALGEDIGAGDITTDTLVPARTRIEAIIFARADIVVSGNELAEAVFRTLDPAITYSAVIRDGGKAKRGRRIAVIKGKARPILKGERTALNFLQRMSGIATLTSKFVKKAAPYGVAVLDTRKTTPLLRDLEKYAVRCGGGINHRMGLDDRVLIKDNHRKLLRTVGKSAIAKAIAKARRSCPGIIVEVEVETKSELQSALRAGPVWILLDNMSPGQLKRNVEICAGQCLLEASGCITLENIEAIARTGVNAVSLGCLTHSAASADLSLEIVS